MSDVMPEAAAKRLVRPDVKLNYQTWGHHVRVSPVVFLHGWGGASSDWQKLHPHLDSPTRYLSYDAAGFGQSQFTSPQASQQADFSIERYVEDLRVLLEAENLGAVHLVGHSWGGVIAMAFAARYPAQVSSLVVIGSAYFDPANKLHIALKWASYLIAQLLVVSKGLLRRSARLRRWSVRRYFRQPPDQPTADHLLEAVLQSDNHALVQTLLSGYEVEFKQLCPAIQCPTLYIGSQRDVVAPPAYVKAFVPLTPTSDYLLMEDCGHFPMLEQPGELAQVLEKFWLASTTLHE